jgi:transcriptional regulator with XRE-family HTH domain
MERAEILAVFARRLCQAVADSGLTRVEFAARARLDRSSLSQLMNGRGRRLPNLENVVGIARTAGVSTDWLLGVSQGGTVAADVVDLGVEVAPGASQPADERLRRWHAEAAGYKIRYVPANLPDLLKTEAVIRYEFQESQSAQGRIERMALDLQYSRQPETDIEICSSLQSVEALVRGEGIWRALPLSVRREQLEHMLALLDELYPTLRWFLFDARQRLAVPLTVFGPLRAALYLGDMYLVFNSTEHIRLLTRHFDTLIRIAVMQPPEVMAFLRKLARAAPVSR